LQAFKSLTTHAYMQGVRERGWPPFEKRLWQRNYFEHVIRNEDDMNTIREYIVDNPARWAEDTEHPARHTVTTSTPGGAT
jgi:REP element-mobilizing transposase RayT